MSADRGRQLTAFTLIRICSRCDAILALLVAVGLISPAPAASICATASPSTQQQKPIESHAALVIVEASVADKHGNFLGALDRSQFHVFDDGVEQPLSIFQTVQEPPAVCVLVETSPAVYLIQRDHLVAAYALLDGLPADAQVALATYDTGSRLVLPFTTDKAALLGILDGLQYFLGPGDLSFYDAVNNTLSWLEARHSKQALLVLSIGLDSSPAMHWEALERQIQTGYVQIFSVALGGELRDYKGKGAHKPDAAGKKGNAEERDSGNAIASLPTQGPPPTQPDFQRATKALQTIAEESGGRAYFPSKSGDFVRFYQQIAAQLRNQYFLAYVPPARDGKVHAIEVRITDAQGKILGSTKANNALHIYARQSYLAPEK
jgi:Ca-activated chloride channel homolog